VKKMAARRLLEREKKAAARRLLEKEKKAAARRLLEREKKAAARRPREREKKAAARQPRKQEITTLSRSRLARRPEIMKIAPEILRIRRRTRADIVRYRPEIWLQQQDLQFCLL
jgi:hypothetical protein